MKTLDPSAPRPAGFLLQRLLLAILPPALALAALDHARAAATTERAEAVFALVADPAVPLPELILGPSLAVHGVDPAALGPGFWNLGLDGAGLSYLRGQYALFRRHKPAPARVVLVLPWYALRPGSGARKLADDAEYLDWHELQLAAGPPGSAWLDLVANRFPLWKQRERLLQGGPEPAWHVGEDYRRTRGYAPFERPKGGLKRLEHNVDLPDEPARIAELGAWLDALRADGVAVALVHAPTYRPSTPAHRESQAAFAKLAADRGMPRFDYEADPRLAVDDDPAAFRDWSHLLAGPSARLSRLLADDLRRSGFLPAGP